MPRFMKNTRLDIASTAGTAIKNTAVRVEARIQGICSQRKSKVLSMNVPTFFSACAPV